MSPILTTKIKPEDALPLPLPMGGKSPSGAEIAANQRYLTLNGRPWLPVMGEFHFSRYPADRWEEELLKMKAGGITVVATYLFWIHHEEIEGQFTWMGNNDVRRFIGLCGEHGLYAYPRIGPWAHGECRNGGFPDWLLERCGKNVRQDAPLYLSYVRRFYQEIFRQLDGLLWKDGGPVIGIQIENELLNNAGHIHTLQGMAREIGFDVPIYTMTGWGPAEVPDGQEIIPVFGGYPDAFWVRQVEDWSRPSRKHYFFSYLRDDNTIGADLNWRSDAGDLSHLERFPYGTCETGGGMQVAYHRRPFIQPDDVAALAFTKVGNGSNLQGYYMYHGGSHPIGQLSYMQESQATGYWNDVPVINYDFQAPLGQYGQVRESYHALRLLHLFLADFGARLAPLPMTLPEVTPSSLDDRQTLRWAVRSDGRQGFLFINNYQRIESLPAHENVQFHLELPGETLTLPSLPVNISAGVYTLWPFNLDLDGVQLKYATAQPVCRLENGSTLYYVFFAAGDIPAEFVFAARGIRAVTGASSSPVEGGHILVSRLEPGPGCLFTIETDQGSQVQILLLNQSQARSLWMAELWGQPRLFLSPDNLIFAGDTLRIQAGAPGEASFSIYPDPTRLMTADGSPLDGQPDGIFTRYTIPVPAAAGSLAARRIQAAAPARQVPLGPLGVAQAPEDADFAGAEVWQVSIPAEVFSNAQEVDLAHKVDLASEIFLKIDYVGDAARAYLGERLIDDHFYNGRAWAIGLSRFAAELPGQVLTLRFLPLRKDAPIYIPPEYRPAFDQEEAVLQVKSLGLRVLAEVQVFQK